MRLLAQFVVTALLGAILPGQGNLLVGTTFRNNIHEVTPTGTVVRTFSVPWPGSRPGTEYVRDMVVHPTGDLYTFNGTFSPYLSVRSAKTGAWTHYNDPNWRMPNNVSYGGIAVLGDWAFVPSGFTNGGLFRFDMTTSRATRFGTANFFGFFDVSVGQDGKLYGLATDERTVDVFDPSTLQSLRSIQLPIRNARGIAVDGEGHIFVVTWGNQIQHYDSEAKLINAITLPGQGNHDIDLDRCGGIIAASRNGDVYRTDKSLTAVVRFQGTSSQSTVAYASPLSQPMAAQQVARQGMPANPDAFRNGSTPPALGAVWNPTVRPFLPGATMDFVGVSSRSANVSTPIGTLLLDPNAPFIMLMGATGASFQLQVPRACEFAGRTFVAQAGSINSGGCKLTNALDVTVGWF